MGEKLSFDRSLNSLELVWSLGAGGLLASNSIAQRFYARLQREGTSVKFVSDSHMVAMGTFDAYMNVVTVNMFRHSSSDDAVSTIVHEAKHQHRFFQCHVEPTTQYEEYLAFKSEFFFKLGRRPTLPERQRIIEEVVKPSYPNLAPGNLPKQKGK